MIEQQDRRRAQGTSYETPANRQTVLLKLTAFLSGETPGPVMHAVFVDRPSYPNAAGTATLTYAESTRQALCWVNEQAFSVGQVVLAINQGERYYAIGRMT